MAPIYEKAHDLHAIFKVKFSLIFTILSGDHSISLELSLYLK